MGYRRSAGAVSYTHLKATDRKLVVGLEIGTAKVAALVGEVLPDGMINIIGVGSCPSRGMDKGGVDVYKRQELG